MTTEQELRSTKTGGRSMSKLDFEQRQRAKELVDRINDDLEEYAFQIVFLEAENERLRAELAAAYAEFRKLSGRVRGIFDREVWNRAKLGE